MKLGLYMDHGVGNGVGGAEVMMARLASEWSREHDVDLISHRPELTRERFAVFTQAPLDRVRLRVVAREPEPPVTRHPVRRFRQARDWQAALSEGYDFFVNSTHWAPCFSRARASALLVLFPFYVRPPDMPETERLPTWKQLRMRAYEDFEWRRRLATYRYRWAISNYSRRWTARRWGFDCPVIFPPVDTNLPRGPKDNLILAVGRFSTLAHTKKQLEMMTAFGAVQRDALPTWRFACVGGLNTRPQNREYFERVRAAGEPLGAIVEANVPRERVTELFGRARIYWQATGAGDDTDRHPELAEHFGIATVEAMAAGCVPIVANKGGPAEIVQHGVSGFVWNTMDELAAFTRRVAGDPALLERMSTAAMARARDFTGESFVERVSALCHVPLANRAHVHAPAYAT